jgi:hypothetical protein
MSFEQLKCALFSNSRPGKTYLKKVCFYQRAATLVAKRTFGMAFNAAQFASV